MSEMTFQRTTPEQHQRLTGVMSILTKDDGDLKVVWDAKNEAEVTAAKSQFDAMRKQGYLAFKVKKDGTQGVQITTFDPEAEAIILSPAMVGG